MWPTAETSGASSSEMASQEVAEKVLVRAARLRRRSCRRCCAITIVGLWGDGGYWRVASHNSNSNNIISYICLLFAIPIVYPDMYAVANL